MKQILLVEDDRDQALLIREALKEALRNVRIVRVETGSEVLEMDLTPFDAILLDYNLPDMTGLDVLRAISDRPRGPVLMVTGEEVLDIAVQAIKEGADDFIIKSFELYELLPHIVKRTIKNFQQKRDMAELEAKEREKKIQIETLKRIMITLTHYLNNAITPIIFSAEICQQSGYSTVTTRKLVETCLQETRRINAIIERFEEYAESEEVKYKDYLDLKDAMFDVQNPVEENPEVNDATK